MGKKIITFIVTIIVLIACNKIDSTEKYTIYSKVDDSSTYILIIKGDSRTYSYKSDLKIDIKTLKDYGEFLTDNNKVYRKYDISDETIILELEDVDRKTFSTFGTTIYAHDKYNIFDSRDGKIVTADVESFRPVKTRLNNQIVTGKDKNNYYFWDEILSDTSGLKK